MSDFYRRFLSEDVRKMGAPSGRQVFLAAFGKHPGWDDHVEDLGLETESLIFAKTLLYVKGIGGQIDSGAWEKLDAAQQLPAFKHLFLWQVGRAVPSAPPQLIIGRMWSSSDGKGRTRYPMIVCAQCAGVPLDWAIAHVPPRLEQIERACVLTNSAAEVRSTLDRHRNELRAAVAGGTAPSGSVINSSALTEFVNHSALGPDKEGWFRIVYQMQSQMAPFAPGRFSLKGDMSGLRPQQIRVPACGNSPSENFLLWSKFFQAQIDPNVPLLLTLPLEETWVDVTAGEPTPAEMFSLRASPKAMPLVTEVPYNLETAFREKARAQVAAFAGDTAMQARGRDATPLAPAPAPATSAPATGGKIKLLRWLGGSAALLAIAAIAVALNSGKRDQSPKQLAAVDPQPNVAVVAPRQALTNLSDETRKAAAASEQARIQRQNAERAEAEARAKVEAQAKAKADEAARQLAIASEAEKRRQAEEQAKRRGRDATPLASAAVPEPAKAEIEAQSKIENPKSPIAAPVIASVVPAPVPSTRSTLNSQPSTVTGRHITNRVGLELVRLPSPEGEGQGEGMWVGKYEVTQGEYVKVMGKNPSKYTGNPRLPVESVSWEDAKRFCEKLTEMEKASGSLPSGFAYDLPTQAQWGALVGDATFEQAVTSQQTTRESTESVGSRAPNKHGLHDVLGNVWEWCFDGPSSQEKALRGGAFNNQKTFRFKPLTPATVHKLAPDQKSHDVGFRCVMAKSQ